MLRLQRHLDGDGLLARAQARAAAPAVKRDPPVLREEVALFINRQHPVQFERLEDLTRYRGGLLFGESYGVAFDRMVAAHDNIEWVSDSGQNFGKLIRGRIDFITQERRTGELYVEHLAGAQDIVALPKALSVDYLRVAVSRRSALASQISPPATSSSRSVIT